MIVPRIRALALHIIDSGSTYSPHMFFKHCQIQSLSTELEVSFEYLLMCPQNKNQTKQKKASGTWIT